MKKIFLVFLLTLTSIVCFNVSDVSASNDYFNEYGIDYKYVDEIDKENPTTFIELISKGLPSKKIALKSDINEVMSLCRTIAERKTDGKYELYSRLTYNGSLLENVNYFAVRLNSFVNYGTMEISIYVNVSIGFQPYGNQINDYLAISHIMYPLRLELVYDVDTLNLKSVNNFFTINNYIGLQDLYSSSGYENIYFKQGYTRITNTLNLTDEEISQICKFYEIKQVKTVADVEQALSSARQDGYEEGYNQGQNDDFNSYQWLISLLGMTGRLFNLEMLPGLTIGMVALIPIALCMLPFLLGLLSGSITEGQKIQNNASEKKQRKK